MSPPNKSVREVLLAAAETGRMAQEMMYYGKPVKYSTVEGRNEFIRKEIDQLTTQLEAMMLEERIKLLQSINMLAEALEAQRKEKS